MICPTCKSDEGLTVSFVGTARLTGDGSEDVGDHEWGSGSDCSCDCGWQGLVADAEAACTELNELDDEV
jgi:hypothetical protein